MKVALIVSNPDPEIVWNAFRLANLMLNEDDDVSIFLHGSAVEFRRHDSEQFPLNLLAKTFALSEGVLLAWGKCLGLHGVEADEHMRQSTQKEMYQLIKESDKVLCF